MARTLALTIALASVFPVSTVRAQPSRVEVDVVAPPECPSAEQLSAEIKVLAGARIHGEWRLTAVVEMWQSDDGDWHARVETLSKRRAGERHFEGVTCDEVAAAAAALLALAVDVDEPAPEKPAPVQKRTIKEARSVSASSEKAEATHSPMPHSSRYLVRLVGGADYGVYPGVVPSYGLGVGWERGALRIDLNAVAWAPSEVTLDGDADVGASLEFWSVGARGCRTVPVVALCAGAEWGMMRGESYGVRMPEANRGMWFAATAEASRAWHLGDRFALVADFGAVAPVVSPRFYIQGESVHSPAPIIGRGRLGVQVSFP